MRIVKLTPAEVAIVATTARKSRAVNNEYVAYIRTESAGGLPVWVKGDITGLTADDVAKERRSIRAAARTLKLSVDFRSTQEENGSTYLPFAITEFTEPTAREGSMTQAQRDERVKMVRQIAKVVPSFKLPRGTGKAVTNTQLAAWIADLRDGSRKSADVSRELATILAAATV